ncbi:MAG: DUF2065 domain-containing protein [Wenzhouxiangellaceae bacterium]|nr:DUF2065 domain-containing protein [Wenzhouxiangellaceae bacterium]
MGQDLLLALALVMVLEGLMPALSPRAWRNAVEQLSGLSDRAIRITGAGLIVVGALLFHAVR